MEDSEESSNKTTLKDFMDKAERLNVLCMENHQKIGNFESDRDVLQIKLVELSNLYKSLTASNEVLELSIANNSIDESIIVKEHIKLNKINDGLKLIIESLSHRLREESYKFITEKSDLESQYQQLVADYQAKGELCDELNKKLERCVEDEEILSRDIHDLKERKKYLEKQNKRLEYGYQIMEEKMYAMRSKVEEEQKDKENMIVVLKKSSEKLKQALQCDRDKIEKLERAEREIERLKKFHKKQKEEYDLQIAKLKHKISSLQISPTEKSILSGLKFW